LSEKWGRTYKVLPQEVRFSGPRPPKILVTSLHKLGTTTASFDRSKPTPQRAMITTKSTTIDKEKPP